MSVLVNIYGNVFDLAKVMQEATYLSLEQMPKEFSNENIYSFVDYLRKNVPYKADDKEQKVRTWQNLLKGEKADCKTYTSLCKAFYLQKSIPTSFIFLARNNILAHVCSISLGKECIIIDLLSKEIFHKLQDYLKKFNFSEFLIV